MSLLEVAGLAKEFGGVNAISELHFSVPAGIVFSIIGPNGAGKTTLLNLLSGIYAPSSGRISFDGRPLAGRAPHEHAAAGIARTFQNLQIFFNMSALENVLVGRTLHDRCGLATAMLRLPGLARAERAAREEAASLMRFVGLEEWVGAEADAMPYGALKRLEIARALAARPRLLLLDEPSMGLAPRLVAEIFAHVAELKRLRTTTFLVEHNMRLVMDISDHILVLDYGKRLAEGTADEVRNDPRVIEAYLGAAATA